MTLLRSSSVRSIVLPVLLAIAGSTPPSNASSHDDVTQIDVPVRVVTFGYSSASVSALRTHLRPYTVHQSAFDLNQPLPNATNEGPEGLIPLGSEWFPLPLSTRAAYEVLSAPPSLSSALSAALASARRGFDFSGASILDGRKIEDWLANQIPANGIPIHPDTPMIVLLHLDALGVGAHVWQYDLPNGISATPQRRVFGERRPILVLDPSTRTEDCAELEPVCAPLRGSSPRYQQRLGATGTDLLHVASLVRDATRYRLLQGNLYPISTAPCHALTLVYAWRPTSVGGHLGMRPDVELFDPVRIRSSFERLVGASRLFVDTKVVQLPVDDPALDALIRGEAATFEAQRLWLHLNWDRYWVPHDGCEAYVTLVAQNDAATAGAGIVGIGSYDEGKGYRIALGWMNEALRFVFDPDSPAGIGTSYRYDWINQLFTHETGHIFGQRHPHDINEPGCRTEQNQTFGQIWSTMSYAGGDAIIEFGAIDAANWARNRAGAMIAAARAKGLQETAEFAEALDHLAAYRWLDAGDALMGPVNTGARVRLEPSHRSGVTCSEA